MPNNEVHIIMPVKDSLLTAERAIRAIIDSGYTLTVYNDYSTPGNTERLHNLAQELSFSLIDLDTLTSHSSPNYRTVLIHARETALTHRTPLLIIESDVIVQPDTINTLLSNSADGLTAAVTQDENGSVNFPYDYARTWKKETIATRKRLSFCCTMLSTKLLSLIDFEKELNPDKNWYDVTISHLSLERGLTNYLQMDNPVLHLPHSSRPWKRLKYTHPLRYYWNKLIKRRDRI